jgi:integrase
MWHGVPDDEFGDIVKLFILTMQRRDEIGGLPTSEFNREKRQLEIKGARFKNGKDNTIPLSDAAFDILEKHYDKDRKFIFGRLDTGFSGWSKAKAELDEALGINDPWVFHDCRRTGKTVMEEDLDVPDAVSESILNHAQEGTQQSLQHRELHQQKARCTDSIRGIHPVGCQLMHSRHRLAGRACLH